MTIFWIAIAFIAGLTFTRWGPVVWLWIKEKLPGGGGGG